MKHSLRITFWLLGLFFLAQLIGLAVIHLYSPTITQVYNPQTNNTVNYTNYNLPYGTEPPQNIEPKLSLITIIFAIIVAVCLMLFLMKFGATVFLRIWFFFVVILAIGITLHAFLKGFLVHPQIISLLFAIPLAFLKIFKRNIIVHNATELMIYPGIAAIFVPLLNIWTLIILLVFISLYDMYAVWHAGFMQKMAKYQIHTLKVFSGFFIPYVSPQQKAMIQKIKSKKMKDKKMKVSVAILGGGDIVFPIILAGVVLKTLGLLPALLISVGATIALACLFYASEKGKFYPAMPFITAGCFVALAIAYLL